MNVVTDIIPFRVSCGREELPAIIALRIGINREKEALRVMHRLVVGFWQRVITTAKGVYCSHQVEWNRHASHSPDTSGGGPRLTVRTKE